MEYWHRAVLASRNTGAVAQYRYRRALERYRRAILASRSGEKVLAFDGRGARRLDYERQDHLWVRTARTEDSARASLLVLHMRPVPRQVCLAEGSDMLGHSDGVAKILNILRNYFAPEAVDGILQQGVRFMRFRRTDQSVGEYVAEYDLVRRKTESNLGMEAGCPGRFASISPLGSAALSRHAKSSVMANGH